MSLWGPEMKCIGLSDLFEIDGNKECTCDAEPSLTA